MKKVALLLAALALTTGAFALPAAAGGNNDKVEICHATGSESNPYVVIKVDSHAVDTEGSDHTHHEGDIIPATPECLGKGNPQPTVTQTVTATATATETVTATATATVTETATVTATPSVTAGQQTATSTPTVTGAAVTVTPTVRSTETATDTAVVTTITPTATVTADEVVETVPPGTPEQPDGSLAQTGIDVLGIFLIALLAIAGGTLLYWKTKDEKDTPSHL